MTKALRYAGIDVAKDWLDVTIHGLGQPWRVTSDGQGMKGLIGTLREQGVHLVVLEATGGAMKTPSRRPWGPQVSQWPWSNPGRCGILPAPWAN